MPRIVPNRRFVLVLTLTLAASFLALLAWRMSVAHGIGWTGLQYAAVPKAKVKLPDLGMMTPKPGQVLVVALGSPAERAAIRPGDIVHAVNGVPVTDVHRLRAMERTTTRGARVTYRIAQGAQTRTVAVTSVSPLSLPMTLIGILLPALVGVVFMATSMVVYWRAKTRSRAAWVFYWLCTLAAGLQAVDALRELDIVPYIGIAPFMSDLRMVIPYITYSALAILVWSLLLHLALVFPKEQRVVREHPLVLRWVHTVLFSPMFALIGSIVLFDALELGMGKLVADGVLVLVGAALLIFLYRRSRDWMSTILDHPWLGQLAVIFLLAGIAGGFSTLAADGQEIVAGFLTVIVFTVVSLVLLLAFAVATVAALAVQYLHSDAEEKRQVRWPLWGTITTVVILCIGPLCTMAMAWGEGFIANMELAVAVSLLTRVSYVLIPISFAFGILKHRLMEIDVIIKKTLVYSVVTGLIVALFFVLVAGVGTLVAARLEIRSQTVTVVSTLIVALLFVPLRNRVQRFVERRFFKRRYDANEAEKLIQHEIVAATELQPLLRKVAEYVQQALQTRSVLILAESDDRERFVAQGAIGVPDEVLRGFTLDRDTVARVDGIVAAGTLRLSQNEWTRMKRVNAELVVPARLRGELRGVMVVGSMLSGTLDDDDRRFLEAVAQQVALGIDGLTLSEDMREFEGALEIQRALLPKAMPRVDGVELDATWHPAKIVGGDYFDVLQLGPTTLGLCIADVAGKGMPAALLMANLQAAVKASASASMSPSDVCEKVRNVVCGTLAGGRFVTFFFGMIDTQAMVIRYVNAGHNPPMLLKADGRVMRLGEGGPALARLMQNTAYRAAEERLDEGDVLFLYTDGVTEARNANEEEFGEERLADVIRRAEPGARNVVRDVVASVREFAGGVAHDDVTIVCARILRGAAENVVPFPRAAS